MDIIKQNIFIKDIKVYGIENAIIGMRYPKNSENLSDSIFINNTNIIGEKDLKLLLNLCLAGKDHRKILRMIHVQASVNMPISWWIQYDTYKIGTTANSRSRMHKLGSNILLRENFYLENNNKENNIILEKYLIHTNLQIKKFQKEKNSEIKQQIWQSILDFLPMSYLQERMIDLNYEVLLNILDSRYNEKLLILWRFFCDNMMSSCLYLFLIWQYSNKKINYTPNLNNIKYNV